jgi:hypothetical protein
MRLSSLECLCFFTAVVWRGSSPCCALTIFARKGYFWHRSMTGSQRGFATADMRTMRAPLDSLQHSGWCAGARPQMRNCASGNLEIPGSMLRIARNDGYDSAFSRRDVPELCKTVRPKKSEGAGNAGRSMHPRPRVQMKKHTSIVTTVTPEIIRHSPRNGFTAYFALSPVTRLV